MDLATETFSIIVVCYSTKDIPISYLTISFLNEFDFDQIDLTKVRCDQLCLIFSLDLSLPSTSTVLDLDLN